MAFSDAMIRALVKTGLYSDPAAEAHLADVLIKRRNAIGRSYLPAINPIVDPAFDGATLTFANAAVQAGVAPAPTGGYRAEWLTFDNATGTSTALGTSSTTAPLRMAAPAPLPSAPGAFVRIDITSVNPPHPSWLVPVQTYFQRTESSWKLVGLERLPAGTVD